MLAVDANVLVYAHRREPHEHVVALELLRSLVAGPEPWAIAWPGIQAFFSVVTNPKIWKQAASSPDQAWAQLAALFEAPGIRLLSGPDDSMPFWRDSPGELGSEAGDPRRSDRCDLYCSRVDNHPR